MPYRGHYSQAGTPEISALERRCGLQAVSAQPRGPCLLCHLLSVPSSHTSLGLGYQAGAWMTRLFQCFAKQGSKVY